MKNLYTKLTMLLLCLLGTVPLWADDVEFDVSSSSTSYSGTHNVTLKGRTFTAGEWTGLCLPFDASKEVLDAAFGENGYNIQSYSSYENNTLTFKKVSEVKAATPYFIKVSTTVETPTFKNVTFASNVADEWRAITIANNFVFRGFYYQKYAYQLYDSNQSNEYLWLNADGTLSYKNEGTYVNERPGVNAYFFCASTTSSATKPTISFEGASSGGGSGEGGDTGGGDTGGDSGDQTSLAYKIAHKQQLTDVPTLYITLENQSDNITDDALSKALYKDRSTGDAPYLTATIQVLDNKSDKSGIHLEEFTDEVQIKVRGNSTANPGNGKKAYRLKFPKKHKHDLLGLGYTKRNWTLLANVFDHSLIRNALTYHLNKEVGMDFCPGYKFVDVVINGNYRGTYQISDHVEADANRVNVNEDTGWMLEFQGRSDMLDKPVCFSQNGLQVNIKNPEPTDDTDETAVAAVVTPIQNWFLNTWQPKWTSSSCFSTTNGWRSVNDEESLIKFWIVTELTGDYDGWMTVKAYKEADGDKLFYGPVWDKDLAYGNCSYENSDILAYNNSQNGSSLTGYLQTIAKDPNFAQKVSTTLNTLLDGGLISRLESKVDELAAIVAQTEELNNTKYPRATNAGGLEVSGKETYAEYVKLLKDYLSTRANNVKTQVETILSTATTKQTITLDPTKNSWDTGYQSLYSYAGAYADVTVSPITAVDEIWSTIFLPFDANESQLKAALGGDFELAALTNIENNTFHFAKTDVKSVSASTPYLVRMKSGYTAKTSWTFEDVIVTDVNDNAQSLHGDSIKASFHPQTPNPNNTAYYLSNGQLVQFDNQYSHQGVDNPIYSINGFHFYFISSTTPSIEINEGETLPEGTRAQKHSPLPTLYIGDASNTVNAEIDDWTTLTVEVFDGSKKLGGGLTTVDGVGVKYQGTYDAAKKNSYRFKLPKKQALLGSTKYKQWVLLACNNDTTLIREALAFELGQAVGLKFTPRYQLVDLYVGDSYKGVYLLCDRVKAESGRASVTDDTDWLVQLAEEDEVDLKVDGATDYDLYVEGTTTTPYIVIKNPDPDDMTDAQKTATVAEVQTWFNNFFKDVTTLGDNVNKEQLIRWYIAQEVLCAYKGFSAINAYRSTTTGAADQTLYFGPLWDNSRAFGNYKTDKKKQILDMADISDNTSFDGLMTEYASHDVMRYVFRNLWLQDWFASGVQTWWAANSASLESKLTTAAETLLASITTSVFADNNTAAGLSLTSDDFTKSAQYLKAYIAKRFDYLDAKFKALNENRIVRYNTSNKNALEAWNMLNGQTVNVQLKKRSTVHGNEWNMLTVPFDLDAAGIKTVFGVGAQVKEFSRIEETSTNVGLYFTAVNSIEAGKPYIIKPTADVAESKLVFNNVTFNTDATKLAVTKGTYTLHGTLNKTTLTPTDANDKTIKYLGTGANKNTLLYLTQAASINGCRGYFKVDNNQSAAKAVTFIDSETTEILNVVDFDAADGMEGQRVYNLNGQLLGTSLRSLPQGVYIVGGKKVTK